MDALGGRGLTIGHLWLPSLAGAGASGPLQVKAFGSIDGVGGASAINFSSLSGSISSYTTATGDCIVIGYTVNSGSAFVSATTGCGATWVIEDNFGTYDQGLLVGYAATSGGSSVTITGNVITNAMSIIVAVLGNIPSSPNPVTATATGRGTTTGTTTSLSYTAGSQVLIASSGGPSTPAWVSTSWSNGATNTHIKDTSASQMVSLDASVASTGSSTTVSATRTTGNAISCTVVALNHN